MRLPKLSLIIALIFLVPDTGFSQKKNLKIITYNVLYGFDFGNSKERATRWLKKQNADIIAFQELKGYDSLSIKNMALQWNHPHVVLWNRPGAAQPLAITSKMPIKKIELLKEDTKDKGALIVKTNGIVFINVHLHPNNVKRRQQEAKAIITHAKALEKNGDRVVILGDFNAMSPYDKTYINGNLNTRLKNSIAKGKCADLVNSCKSWDFSVLQSFYDAQFEDVVASLLTNKSEMISKRVYGSFPSTLSKNINSYEEKSENLHRLDYVLVSKTASIDVIQAQIVQDSTTEKISDHYPVVVKINTL